MYPNPPISEATAEIRFSSVANGVELIAELARGMPGWHKVEEVRTVETMIPLAPDGTATSDNRLEGYRVDSDDGQWVVVLTRERLSVTNKRPYAGWSRLRNMIREWSDRLNDAGVVAAVQRCSIRTINRLDLPLPIADFREYLRTYPEVSPDLPQRLGGFLLRLIVPQPDRRSTAVITEGVLKPELPGTVALALDIDLVHEVELKASSPEIWECFEWLHSRKNEIFEACITDRTRELFA